jgi:hypothetical protein
MPQHCMATGVAKCTRASRLCHEHADVECRCCADLILFTATANTSIVTLNLSLLLNKVGFYQVRSMIPHIMHILCAIEFGNAYQCCQKTFNSVAQLFLSSCRR